MTSNNAQVQFSDDDGRPRWDEILKRMLAIVFKSRIKENNSRQSPESVVQSAIKTSLDRAQKFGIEEGDPAFYSLLFASLDRKIDTAKHAYRTGLGKTAKFSALGSDEFAFMAEFETKNFGGKRSPSETPSINDTIEIKDDEVTSAEVEKPQQPDESTIVERLASRFDTWITGQLGELDEPTRKIAFLWSQTYTIDEMVEETGMTRKEVEAARNVIREKFLKGEDDA
tara:strand:- start:6933 stop:7613 length:681 start_codon:yes stop_codon:yes gene_type:complete